MVAILSMERYADGVDAPPLPTAERSRRSSRRGPPLTAEPPYLSAVAHELRTPLAALVASSEILVEDFDRLDPRQVQEIVGTIYRGSIWLQSMVENLLYASSMREGRLGVRPRPTDPLEIVGEIRPLLAPLLDQKGQDLRLMTAGTPRPVEADALRIGQVLLNLTLNASKFAPSGTPIRLLVDWGKRSLRVSVLDRGPGIPPGSARRLFAPFHQEHPTEGAPAKGVGLGLAIVQAIVEAHGGRAGARNRRGGGACFWFELPYSAPPASDTV